MNASYPIRSQSDLAAAYSYMLARYGGGGGSLVSGVAAGLPQWGQYPAARGMKGFDGDGEFDFAVGAARGYRWWTVPGYKQYCNCAACKPSAGHAPFTALEGATGLRWGPGILEARCNHLGDHHKAPVEGCGCGFWAYWDFRRYSTGSVCGVIEGTGRTLIGENGFRCQRARIVALCVLTEEILRPLLDAINERARMADGAVRVDNVTLRGGGLAVFNKITGRAGAYSKPRPELDRERREAEEGAEARAAAIQERLMELYPDAEVFATQRAMMLKYPPVGRP